MCAPISHLFFPAPCIECSVFPISPILDNVFPPPFAPPSSVTVYRRLTKPQHVFFSSRVRSRHRTVTRPLVI